MKKPLLLIFLLTVLPVFATTYYAYDLDAILTRADIIVFAEVSDVTMALRDEVPWTTVSLEPLRVLKGDEAKAAASIAFYGGNAEGHSLEVEGMPRLNVGEQVLILRYDNDSYASPLVGFSQGLWTLEAQGFIDNQQRVLAVSEAGVLGFVEDFVPKPDDASTDKPDDAATDVLNNSATSADTVADTANADVSDTDTSELNSVLPSAVEASDADADNVNPVDASVADVNDAEANTTDVATTDIGDGDATQSDKNEANEAEAKPSYQVESDVVLDAIVARLLELAETAGTNQPANNQPATNQVETQPDTSPEPPQENSNQENN